MVETPENAPKQQVAEKKRINPWNIILIIILFVIGWQIGVYIRDNNQALPIQSLTSELTAEQQQICPKIESQNTAVRDAAVSIARDSEGKWNVGQLVDLFVWMKTNIKYVNDPSTGNYYAFASETLQTKAGDCDDQAILITSMIRSVGGTSNMIIVNECTHAFASVFISESKADFDKIREGISNIYYNKYSLQIGNTYSYKDEKGGYWLIVDPAGGQYLGDELPDCRNERVEIIDC